MGSQLLPLKILQSDTFAFILLKKYDDDENYDEKLLEEEATSLEAERMLPKAAFKKYPGSFPYQGGRGAS